MELTFLESLFRECPAVSLSMWMDLNVTLRHDKWLVDYEVKAWVKERKVSTSRIILKTLPAIPPRHC